MYNKESYAENRQEAYGLLLKQLAALIEGVHNPITNYANAAALLNQFLQNINWVGFYHLENDGLSLYPFQGLPACVHIPVGKGVCGQAVSLRQTQRVEDVHAFPGHIACDAASRSELVIPIMKENTLIAVLDIDAPIPARFDEIDQQWLEAFVEILAPSIA